MKIFLSLRRGNHHIMQKSKHLYNLSNINHLRVIQFVLACACARWLLADHIGFRSSFVTCTAPT